MSKEYTEELEKALIFMCDVYSTYQDSISCQENNGETDDKWVGVYMSLPTIQGTSNRIYVEKIGNLRTKLGNREAPQLTFEELYKVLKLGRKETLPTKDEDR